MQNGGCCLGYCAALGWIRRRVVFQTAILLKVAGMLNDPAMSAPVADNLVAFLAHMSKVECTASAIGAAVKVWLHKHGGLLPVRTMRYETAMGTLEVDLAHLAELSCGAVRADLHNTAPISELPHSPSIEDACDDDWLAYELADEPRAIHVLKGDVVAAAPWLSAGAP